MSKKLRVVVWSKEGCSYCNDVKTYLKENNIEYETIDITNRDEFREVLNVKYGVRHVPVVEIGQNGTYTGVTEVGLEHLKKVLENINVSI